MECKLQNKYDIRVILYFKKNSISYGDMHRFILREAGTLPDILMRDCKTMFDNRKWATFYTEKERVDRLKTSLEVNNECRSMFKISFLERMGKEVLP